MKLRNTPEERFSNLLAYLGWAGGTIHQVAEVTGVNCQDLLDGSKPCGADPEPIRSRFLQGSLASETCGLRYRLRLVPMVRGDAAFWLGVGEAIPQSLRDPLREATR